MQSASLKFVRPRRRTMTLTHSLSILWQQHPPPSPLTPTFAGAGCSADVICFCPGSLLFLRWPSKAVANVATQSCCFFGKGRRKKATFVRNVNGFSYKKSPLVVLGDNHQGFKVVIVIQYIYKKKSNLLVLFLFSYERRVCDVTKGNDKNSTMPAETAGGKYYNDDDLKLSSTNLPSAVPHVSLRQDNKDQWIYQ